MFKKILIVLTTMLISNVSFADEAKISHRDWVSQDEIDTYIYTCQTPENKFIVQGIGYGDIDCCLSDANGYIIACDNSQENKCIINFYASDVKKVYLRVVNAQPFTTEYVLKVF